MTARSPAGHDPGLWGVQALRLTLFKTPAAEAEGSAGRSWEALIGQPPETRVSQPAKGEEQEGGAYADAKLVTVRRKGRIDWAIGAAADALAGPPVIGRLPAVLETFQALMIRWLEDAPPAQRLALGTKLSQHSPSLEGALEGLLAYLPLGRFDIAGGSDFLYQINRRRVSQVVDGLGINRFCKWSVASWRSIELDNVGGPIRTRDQFTFEVELDVNTLGEFDGELPRANMERLFRELAALTVEIAAQGDTR